MRCFCEVSASVESPLSLPQLQTHSTNFSSGGGAEGPSLCIAVIGATGELARRKIFPALFALYYSGFLPEVRSSCFSLFKDYCFLFYVVK